MNLDTDTHPEYCPHCGDLRCPLCGSKLVVLAYRGKKPDILAAMQSCGFSHFVGCVRADLHDKVVEGVDYRGKAYVILVFDGNDVAKRTKSP